MSIYLRSGSEHYRMRFQHYGVRVRRTTRTSNSEEALKAVEQLKAEIEESLQRPEDIRLKDAIERTYDARWGCQADGEAAYSRAKVLLKILGNRRVKALRPCDVAKVKTTLKAQGVTPGTLKKYLTTLSTVLKETQRSVPNLEVLKLGLRVELRGARL